MAKLLHLLTRPADALTESIIAQQRATPGHEVEVIDLTRPDTDYAVVVERIFAADSVATW